MKKTIAILLLVFIGLAALSGVMNFSEGFVLLLGLGMIVTGIWSSVLLLKSK